VRQYDQLHTFLREPVPEGATYAWDFDQRLRSCLALSRLVHPTSVSLEYSARIFYDDRGRVKEVCPGPVKGRAAGAYVLPEWRDWLIDSELEQLRKLLASTPWTALPDRLRRALWHHELASAQSELDVRWTLICTALEALVHTDRLKSTKQFTTRLPLLAIEVGISGFSASDAERTYEYRSRLAHGGTLADVRRGTPAHVAMETIPLYRMMEDILREALKKSLIDPEYAAIFNNDDAIRSHWPLDLS